MKDYILNRLINFLTLQKYIMCSELQNKLYENVVFLYETYEVDDKPHCISCAPRRPTRPLRPGLISLDPTRPEKFNSLHSKPPFCRKTAKRLHAIE